jgi:hypothetical protein
LSAHDVVWRAAGRTHKVRVGGLGELLLSVLAGGAVCGRVSYSCRAMQGAGRGEGGVPAERVPSNTWLISMIAGGCFTDKEGYKEGKREVEVGRGREPQWRVQRGVGGVRVERPEQLRWELV